MTAGDRAVFVAVAGATSIATSATLVRLADVAPATAAAFRCLYALPILALFALRERRTVGPPTRREHRYALAAGVFFAVDLVLWHHAINYVGAGIATVLGNLQVVFVTVAAWLLLGERPGARFATALPIVLTGVVLITGVFEDGAYGVDPVRGVIFGLGTSVAYAISLLLLRAGAGESRRGSAALLDFTLAAAVASAAMGPIAGGFDPIPAWPAHGWLVLLAVVAQALGWLLISYALPRLRAAMTALLLLFQPLGAMLLAAAVLSEQPSLLQLTGCGLVLAGVLLAAQRERASKQSEQARAGVVVATPNATTPTAGAVVAPAD
jgi:drug/metabolite transporter (DMT)-like permease